MSQEIQQDRRSRPDPGTELGSLRKEARDSPDKLPVCGSDLLCWELPQKCLVLEEKADQSGKLVGKFSES